MNEALFGRFWHDQHGGIISIELILILTVLVIGVIVGVKSVRDAVVTELADVGQALSNFSQSYFYGGVQGHESATTGSGFVDRPDFCDRADNTNVQQSKGVAITPLNPGGPNADGAQSP